jgi:hypothetical protein
MGKGLLILPYTGDRGGWVGGSVKREDSHEGKLEDLYRSKGSCDLIRLRRRGKSGQIYDRFYALENGHYAPP